MAKFKWQMAKPRHFPFTISHAPFAILFPAAHCFLPTAYFVTEVSVA
jgi:hypothetical protein